jgi:hypothetical protein
MAVNETVFEPGLPAPVRPRDGVLPLHGFQKEAVAAAVTPTR